MGMSVGTSSASGDEDDGGYRPVAEINITPMVDVMLVLLIIFMVAAPLMVAGVPLELPNTSAARVSQSKKAMVVSMAGDGGLYIREEQVSTRGARSPPEGAALAGRRYGRLCTRGQENPLWRCDGSARPRRRERLRTRLAVVAAEAQRLAVGFSIGPYDLRFGRA